MQKNFSYDGEDTDLFATDAYGGTKDDVDGTEQYSADIDLTQRPGITCKVTFAEIGADSNDNLLIKLYYNTDSTWDGDEIVEKTVVCTNDGSEDIKNIRINARASGYGHCRFGVVRDGSTDTFDVEIVGRYW
jgi:hypothetical protein